MERSKLAEDFEMKVVQLEGQVEEANIKLQAQES